MANKTVFARPSTAGGNNIRFIFSTNPAAFTNILPTGNLSDPNLIAVNAPVLFDMTLPFNASTNQYYDSKYLVIFDFGYNPNNTDGGSGATETKQAFAARHHAIAKSIVTASQAALGNPGAAIGALEGTTF